MAAKHFPSSRYIFPQMYYVPEIVYQKKYPPNLNFMSKFQTDKKGNRIFNYETRTQD